MSDLGLMVSQTSLNCLNHNTKLFYHKYVKYTIIFLYRLNVLLEYFDLFEEIPFGTVLV